MHKLKRFYDYLFYTFYQLAKKYREDGAAHYSCSMLSLLGMLLYSSVLKVLMNLKIITVNVGHREFLFLISVSILFVLFFIHVLFYARDKKLDQLLKEFEQTDNKTVTLHSKLLFIGMIILMIILYFTPIGYVEN